MTEPKNILTFFKDVCTAAIPPIVVIILQYIRMHTLPMRSELDVLAHVMGGVAIGWMSMILLERWRRRGWAALRPFIFRDYIVFSTVSLVGVVWEFWEFIMQAVTGDIYQPSIADTMNDLLMDLIGALILIAIYRIIRHIQQTKKGTITPKDLNEKRSS